MILHIAERSEWEAAQRERAYRPKGFAIDGFIHCSTSDQVIAVANAFYRGRGGLVLLHIDEARLQAKLRWEAAPAAETAGPFPHLYGPLNLDAVVRAVLFEPDADGRFHLPPLT